MYVGSKMEIKNVKSVLYDWRLLSDFSFFVSVWGFNV